MSVILATGGYDHKIRFWEAPSGICSRTIRFPDSQVNCLEITPDKQFLSAGGNPHIRLYEINSSTNHHPVLSCEGHSSSVTSLGFQRDGRWMYSGSEDGTIKIFDLRSPTYQRSFDSRGPVRSVRLHPNQMVLMSGDQNGSVKIWDLRMGMTASMNTSIGTAGGGSVPPSSSGSGAGTSAASNGSMGANGAGSTTAGPGGGLLSSSQTMNTPGGGPIVPPPSGGNNTNSNIGGRRGESGSACINELIPDASTSLPSLPSSATKLMTTSTPGKGATSHRSSVSSNGKYAATAGGSNAGQIGASTSASSSSNTAAPTVVKTTSNSTTNNPNPNHSTSSTATATRTSSTVHTKITPIQSVDINERTAIAVNANGEVFAWDPTHTTQFRPLAKFRAHPPHSYCLCAKLSPDGRHFVTTGSDCTARLWNTTSWDITTTLAAHQRWVWDAVFSADSSYLVTASSDHSARLWNLRTGEVVRQYTGHQSAVTCVALNDSST